MPTRDTTWPAGTPCWADLAVPDVPKAVEFYSAVLGWSLVDSGEEFGHYHIAQVEGHAAAGVGPTMAGGPAVVLDALHRQRRHRRHRQADHRQRRQRDHGADGRARARAACASRPTRRAPCSASGSRSACPAPGSTTSPAASRGRTPGSPTSRRAARSTPPCSAGPTRRSRAWTLSEYGTFHGGGDPLGGLGGLMGAPEGTPSHWLVYFGTRRRRRRRRRGRAARRRGACSRRGHAVRPHGVRDRPVRRALRPAPGARALSRRWSRPGGGAVPPGRAAPARRITVRSPGGAGHRCGDAVTSTMPGHAAGQRGDPGAGRRPAVEKLRARTQAEARPGERRAPSSCRRATRRPQALEPCHVPAGTTSCGRSPASRSGPSVGSSTRPVGLVGAVEQEQPQRRARVPVVGLGRAQRGAARRSPARGGGSRWPTSAHRRTSAGRARPRRAAAAAPAAGLPAHLRPVRRRRPPRRDHSRRSAHRVTDSDRASRTCRRRGPAGDGGERGIPTVRRARPRDHRSRVANLSQRRGERVMSSSP